MVPDKATATTVDPGTDRPGRPRVLLSLAVGAAVIGGLYGGPPVDSVAGVDLRWGLSGPLAGDPWKWLGAGLLMLVVLVVERRGAASLLLCRPSGRDLEWVLYAFGAVMTWSWVVDLVAPQDDNAGVATIAALGVGGALVLVVTAAVTEEVVYRGFLAERIGDLLGSGRWARACGAGVSLAVFTVPHLAFFGPSWMWHQLPGALALTLLVLLRRNLPAAMLLHLGLNLPVLIVVVGS